MRFSFKRIIQSLLFFGIFLLIFNIIEKLVNFGGAEQGYLENQEINRGEIVSCADLQQLSIAQVLGNGWTKTVYKGTLNGQTMAVKTINTNGQAMKNCKESYSACQFKLVKGLLRESMILKRLKHPNIIKVYGSCFAINSYSSLKGNAIFVEFGQPLQSFSLVQKDFSERLKLAKDIASLLLYLHSSPFGPILVPDLRLQQFIVVEGCLKLADIDDAHFGERTCTANASCIAAVGDGKTIKVPCVLGHCKGLMDLINMRRACREILPFLLQFGAPKNLEEEIEGVLSLCNEGLYSSEQLGAFVQRIKNQYVNKFS